MWPDAECPLTLRALATFDPGVLWTLLLHLNYLPEALDAETRADALADERMKMRARVREAQQEGRDGLVKLATEFYEDARAMLATVPRTRREGTKKESARRRRRALAALVAGLEAWTLIDIARLVMESSRAWRRPPCASLVENYALGGDDRGCVTWLADVFRQDLKR